MNRYNGTLMPYSKKYNNRIFIKSIIRIFKLNWSKQVSFEN